MIDKIFNICVDILEWSAQKLNMTYEQINVLIFVVLMPIVFLAMLILLIIKW